MSVCTFIASDLPLAETVPVRDTLSGMDTDDGAIVDGGADDSCFLLPFADVRDYTGKEHGVCLEWEYTEGGAERLVEYIRHALRHTASIELWHVWLMDCYEYEHWPVVHRQTISVDELTPRHIKEIDDAEIWNTPDKMYPDRPSFYCLEIRRS